MLVNLNPRIFNVSFQKRIVERELTTKTQKNLCDCFVKEESNTDVFNNSVAKPINNECEMKASKIEVKLLTPEEFQIKKVNLMDKIKNSERLKDIKESDINEHSTFVLEAIVKNPDLMNYKNFTDNVDLIIFYTRSVESAKIITSALDTPGTFAKLENLQQSALAHPELYVDDECSTVAGYTAKVDAFFWAKYISILKLSSSFDKAALNCLMRKGFDDFGEYLNTINKFSAEDMNILTKLSNSVGLDGKPLMPTQKIDIIDLIAGYKANGLELSKFKEMAENNQVDLDVLKFDFFKGIMKNSGLTDAEIATIPKEKLTGWDTSYAHILAKEIAESKDQAFNDLFRAANLDDFNRYIHDTSNVYGQTNKVTQATFEKNGLNYQAWLKPSKKSEVKFQATDKNKEQLQQVTTQLLEDIEVLRGGPVKGFIDKAYPKFIKDEQFFIPNDIANNKVKLKEFITNFEKQLEQVWTRAAGNAKNEDPNRAKIAQSTLTIHDHIKQRILDVENVKVDTQSKAYDLTIKMWDRVPQKDINQGNYSTCCIGLGNGNGSAMPHYLMNTSFNMIEIVDNINGRVIGNALVFYVKNEQGNPVFVVDNIEINNSVKPSDKVGRQLRNHIVKYVENVNKEVASRADIKIRMGESHNDVPHQDLKATTEQVKFLGDVDEKIYMDLYGGWTDKDDFTQKVKWRHLN